MKNILFVAATDMELNNLKSLLTEKKHINTFFFTHSIGIPFSLYELQLFFSKSSITYDLVIQIGIAGSFDKQKKIGDVFYIQNDCFADLGALEKNKFNTIFEMGFIEKNKFPFKQGILKNKKIINHSIPIANGITVQQITTNKNMASIFKKKYKAELESMEGACFYFICMKEKIPCMQIRAISNYIGERNKRKWNIALALKHLNDEIINIVEQLRK